MKRKKNILQRDLLAVTVLSLVTLVATLGIPGLVIDSSIEVFIPDDNRLNEINSRIEAEFGSMDSLILGFNLEYGSILEPENLEVLDALTRKMESVPGVKSVLSLTNAEYIINSAGGMEVVPLLEDLSPQSLEELPRRLADWAEVYSGTLISEDHLLAAVIIQPRAGADDGEKAGLYAAMIEAAGMHAKNGRSFPLIGTPVLKEEISRSVFRDILYLIPIAAGLILLVLFLSFRRLEGVLFPLLSLVLACVWIMGLMGALKLTFTMASLLIPVLLLVVGSAYGIHVMAHFYEDLSRETGFLDFSGVCRIIREGNRRIRLSVLLAGATTAGGFISQLASPLKPFRIFGLMSTAGVFFALAVTFLLIPALLRLRYRKGIDTRKFHREQDASRRERTPAFFRLLLNLVNHGRWPVALVSAALIAAAGLSIPHITPGTSMIHFFLPDSRVVQDTNVFNRRMSGTGVISLLVKAPQKGDILDPEFQKQTEDFSSWLPRTQGGVTRVQTLAPHIKRMNKIMNYDRIPFEKARQAEPDLDFFGDSSFGFFPGEDSPDPPAGNTDSRETSSPKTETEAGFTAEDMAALLEGTYLDSQADTPEDLVKAFMSRINYQGEAFYEIPTNPAKYGMESPEELKNLLSQYLLLYSGSLDMMINDPLEPDEQLLTIQTRDESDRELKKIISSIRSYWDYYLPPDWSYVVGGPALFNIVLSDLVSRSQLISLAASLVIVWIILAVMFRSPRAGFIGLVPVFFALAGIFLFMTRLGFHLDIVTSLLAALAVGIGVDYAIHFMNAYRRSLLEARGLVLERVYRATGKAILYNAGSVTVGFLGLLFSRFLPIRQLGILFAVAMIFACLASLIVLPLILIHTDSRFLIRSFRNQKIRSLPNEKVNPSLVPADAGSSSGL